MILTQKNMIMEDLINAHGWVMEEQNMLKIIGSDLNLSIIPEYVYWVRDENGMISRSRTPQGIKLNICVQKACKLFDGSLLYRNEMFLELGSEEEFYDFMIEMQREFCNQSKTA